MRANVIQVAPRVSAPIVALPINDNQFVKAGDLLFEIDPRTYQAALDQAKANLDQTRDRIKDLEAQKKREIAEQRKLIEARQRDMPAARSSSLPLRLFGKIYTSMVRGVPDIIFFLFVPVAMDQGFEWIRHKIKCPDWTEPVWQGSDFVVCSAAKLPLSTTFVERHAG